MSVPSILIRFSQQFPVSGRRERLSGARMSNAGIIIGFSIGFIVFVIISVIAYSQRRAQNAANVGYVLSERAGKNIRILITK